MSRNPPSLAELESLVRRAYDGHYKHCPLSDLRVEMELALSTSAGGASFNERLLKVNERWKQQHGYEINHGLMTMLRQEFASAEGEKPKPQNDDGRSENTTVSREKPSADDRSGQFVSASSPSPSTGEQVKELREDLYENLIRSPQLHMRQRAEMALRAAATISTVTRERDAANLWKHEIIQQCICNWVIEDDADPKMTVHKLICHAIDQERDELRRERDAAVKVIERIMDTCNDGDKPSYDAETESFHLARDFLASLKENRT